MRSQRYFEGTIKNLEFKPFTTNDGRTYVNGKVEIVSENNPKGMSFDLNRFGEHVQQSGATNGMYMRVLALGRPITSNYGKSEVYDVVDFDIFGANGFKVQPPTRAAKRTAPPVQQAPAPVVNVQPTQPVAPVQQAPVQNVAPATPTAPQDTDDLPW